MATVLFLLGVALVVGALVLAVVVLTSERPPTGVQKSLAAIEAMTTVAPIETPEEDERPFSERIIEPLLRRTARIGRVFTRSETSSRLHHRLDVAGNPGDWSADRVASVKVIGAVVVFLIGLAAGALMSDRLVVIALVAIVGLLLGFFLPDLYLYQTTYNRSEQLLRELPDAIDLLTISVESGLGFDAALQQVARHTDGALAMEFARVLAEMQIGRSRSAALRDMAERTTVPDVRSFVSAMVQADSFGIPIGQVLRAQSVEMRSKRRQRAEAKAQQVPVKITLPLIICILPCLFIAVLGPAALSILDTF